MPVLLQVRTADFELTVWARDISNRLETWRSTMRRCLSVTSEHYQQELHLSDAAEVWFGEHWTAGAAVPLREPVFFENTEYQFEWVFSGAVDHAELVHRSYQLNAGFRFAAADSRMPSRLTGNIQTGNDVGWMRLPLRYRLNGEERGHAIAFEVLPTKMLLHRDLPSMYRTIDATFPLWRFSLSEKTAQGTASGRQRGNFPLLWLAQFSRLREQFEQALDVIRQAPHSRLQIRTRHMRADRLKSRISPRVGSRVREDLARGRHDRRYRIDTKQLSVDTPENRFVKMAVAKSRQQLAGFERRLRKHNRTPDRQRLSDAFLDELHSWQEPLQRMLDQSFLQEVGNHSQLSHESLVLQQKTGYSSVYRIWQELKFYLDALSGQAELSMKSVAEVYEVWCFLRIRQILIDDLGFEEVACNKSRLVLNEFFEYQLKDGFAGAFEFRRHDGVEARLAHEPRFTRRGDPIRSFLVAQEPDIVLEVTIPAGPADTGEGGRRFVWLFDAKYRVKAESSRFEDELVEDLDHVPDDAINQMHRYRDAIILLGEEHGAAAGRLKSRPVFGAFALYPGYSRQDETANPYAFGIKEVGIGAFALLPDEEAKNSGSLWLLEFLRDRIGRGQAYGEKKSDQLYIQDAARIPLYGMQQVLYPDLIMTVALGGTGGRCPEYFERFGRGRARWYHIKAATFDPKYKQHVVREIRYLALARTSKDDSRTKQIDRIWPVLGVKRKRRHELTEEQAGKLSSSTEEYYLFELGRPLMLSKPVNKVPHRPIRNTMKLTTLDQLEDEDLFSDVKEVYHSALR